jgi:hypothetical protein
VLAAWFLLLWCVSDAVVKVAARIKGIGIIGDQRRQRRVFNVPSAGRFLFGQGVVVVLLYDGWRGLLLLPAAAEHEQLPPPERGQRLVEQIQEQEDQGEHQGGDPGTRRNRDADERHVVVDREEGLHPTKRGRGVSPAREAPFAAMRARGGPIGQPARCPLGRCGVVWCDCGTDLRERVDAIHTVRTVFQGFFRAAPILMQEYKAENLSRVAIAILLDAVAKRSEVSKRRCSASNSRLRGRRMEMEWRAATFPAIHMRPTTRAPEIERLVSCQELLPMRTHPSPAVACANQPRSPHASSGATTHRGMRGPLPPTSRQPHSLRGIGSEQSCIGVT